MPNDVVTYGTSMTAGNLAGAGNQWPTILQGLIGDGGTVTNLAVGSTTAQQVLDSVLAQSAETLAKISSVEMGRNDVNESSFPDVFDRYTDAVAAITGYCLVQGITNASVEGMGRWNWAQVQWLNRQLAAAFRPNFMDYRYVMLRSGDGSATDWADIANDIPPSSLRNINGTINSLHFGRAGNLVWANLVYQWYLAILGQTVFVQPNEDVFLTGSDAATAQTLRGFVHQAAIVGTPDSCSISDPDNFDIDKTGRITRASSKVLDRSYYDLTITARKEYQTSEGNIRLRIGAADASNFKMVRTTGVGWASQPFRPSNIPNGKQFSCVIALWPMADGEDLVPLGGEVGHVSVTRFNADRYRVILKNAAGDTICSLQTSQSGTHRTADGRKVFFASVNLATAAAYIGLDETDYTQTITVTDDTIDYANHLQVWSSGQGGARRFIGEMQVLWAAAADLNFASATQRAKFYDPATGALRNLGSTGAVDGVTPFVYIGGEAADWSWPYNRSSDVGGEFVMTPHGVNDIQSSAEQFVTDSADLQKPVDYVLAGVQPIKGHYREWDIPPANRSERVTVRRSQPRMLSGQKPSFTVTTSKRGY